MKDEKNLSASNTYLLFSVTEQFPEWEFEKTFHPEENFLKLASQSYLPAVIAGVAYLSITFGGKALMKNRQRYETVVCIFNLCYVYVKRY